MQLADSCIVILSIKDSYFGANANISHNDHLSFDILSSGEEPMCNFHITSYASIVEYESTSLYLWIYSIGQMLICTLFAYGIQNTILKVNSMSLYSKKYSILALFFCTVITASQALMLGIQIVSSESSVLILMIIFISMFVSFIYQICFIVILWKGWRNRVMSYGVMNDEVSIERLKVMLMFSIIALVIVMLTVFNSKLLMRREAYAILCSMAWVFQIAHNVRERNRKSPNIIYFIGLSATTLFHPLYITANPYNFYEYRPNYGIALIAVIIHTITVSSL